MYEKSLQDTLYAHWTKFFNRNLFMASLRAATGINYFNDKIRPNGNSMLVYLIMVINVGTPNFVHLYYLARKKKFLNYCLLQ